MSSPVAPSSTLLPAATGAEPAWALSGCSLPRSADQDLMGTSTRQCFFRREVAMSSTLLLGSGCLLWGMCVDVAHCPHVVVQPAQTLLEHCCLEPLTMLAWEISGSEKRSQVRPWPDVHSLLGGQTRDLAGLGSLPLHVLIFFYIFNQRCRKGIRVCVKGM